MRGMAAVLSVLGLLGCRSDPALPKQAGVTQPLRYPVLLIGQGSLDVRESEEAFTSIPGSSTLNLNERRVLDSDGRLFDVVRAQAVEGQRSPMWDMGTSPRRFFVQVEERGRPTWGEVEALVLDQVHSPLSLWTGDERAVARVRALHDVAGLIDACREAWSWTR